VLKRLVRLLGNSYTIHVNGKPAPQGSKKVQRYVNGRAILCESSPNVMPWRALVAGKAKRLLPEGWHATLPMSLSVTFIFPRPKADFKANGDLKNTAPSFCIKRIGDIDKLLRAICDALTGVAFDDDCQVFSIQAERRYAVGDEQPSAIITVTSINV